MNEWPVAVKETGAVNLLLFTHGVPAILFLLGRLVLRSDRSHHVGMSLFQFALQRIQFGSLPPAGLAHSLLLLLHFLIQSLLLLLIDELSLSQLFLVSVNITDC